MIDADKCSGCNLCGMYCPDFAIFGFKQPDAKAASKPGAAESAAEAPVVEAKEA
jgi:2-oxoglutarate ferredoxin oxidoreductase subunit delta